MKINYILNKKNKATNKLADELNPASNGILPITI